MAARDPEAGERTPSGEGLYAIVGQLMRFLRISKALTKLPIRYCTDLSPQQTEAAMSLVQQDGQTIGELAEALAVSPAWASRLAEELVVAGYAVRERDHDDRRVARLRLTPAMRE